ncbi:MAG TPA: SDR family oxidoreductase [Roseiarcus sp.]
MGKAQFSHQCIAPGLIRTDFARALWDNPQTLKTVTARTPLGRIDETDEIAGAAVYLVSKAVHDRADHRHRWRRDDCRLKLTIASPIRQAMKPTAQVDSDMAESVSSAFEAIPGALDCGALIICDHASNAIPPGYGTLGLPPEALDRHIAYDIGAADATRALAAQLGAPAVLSTYSRLLIDPNRGLDDPTLVMRYSDGAIVPGNAYIDVPEIARRSARFWAPYRQEVAATVDAMMATGEPPALISIHSFTPVMRSLARPWKIGVLWDLDGRIPTPLIEALIAEPDLRDDEVGDNEPYDGALAGDTIDEIATSRGLANALIEIRQDLIAERSHAVAWAERIGRLLAPIIADRRLRGPADFGSRAWATDHRRGKPASAT